MNSASDTKWFLNPFLFVVLAVAGLFVLPSASHAQAIDLTATADRTEIQIADPFEFVIKVTGPPNAIVSFPDIGDQIGSFDVLEIRDQSGLQVVGESNVREWIRTLTLETIETGKLLIPRLEISVQEDAGSPKLLRTEPVEISVAGVVESSADLTKFADIADLVDVDPPESSTMNPVGIWLVAGLALALAGGYFLLAKRQRASVSACEWALAKLSDQECDFGRVEIVVRRFLEERFALPATSLSTAEITGRLSSFGVDQSLVLSVEEVFSVSERVKFGGVQLLDDQEARLRDDARSLVVELSQVELDTHINDDATQRTEVD